ncbi:MAG: CPBP family intramembrane metalloprotease [Alphaproteobacteria bacterium]|nr:CPBP family intramembrane metalloprotease [Alphaproteobacteria bacterium]
MTASNSETIALPPAIGMLALAAAPFYLNDIFFLMTDTAPAWLAVDYGSKLLALGVLFLIPQLRRTVMQTMPLKVPVRDALSPAVLCVMTILLIDHFFRVVFPIEIDSMVLFRYPALDPGFLYWTDITFGLALTAISEEFLFRGVFARLMSAFFKKTAMMVAASAVFFALIHWSHGVTSMVVAAFAGVALMMLYLRTGSVLPGMAAHYAVNFWDFL